MAEIKEFETRMTKTTEVLAAQFAAVRAGRANAAVPPSPPRIPGAW